MYKITLPVLLVSNLLLIFAKGNIPGFIKIETRALGHLYLNKHSVHIQRCSSGCGLFPSAERESWRRNIIGHGAAI